MSKTSKILRPTSHPQTAPQRRGAGISLATIAALGLFGGGAAIGSCNFCGLRGIFGGWQDEAKANAESI